ncbi:CopD family protein [Methylocapsa palsarum]|uniref:Putative copper resistance protein D n=1 Tax=Methylocapsa palsarum TaxID=1612308 RepID=A0A1I4A4B3_9HYPH|nr:CopD family protein [Methylocapsa palsarum]SFK50716.1 putative copper resistance protein D [Methylocapsa palsarum]
MFDPLSLARAIANLGGAIVIGAGFLLWFARGSLANPGGARWRRRVAILLVSSATVALAAAFLFTVGTAAAAAQAAPFTFDLEILNRFLTKTWAGGVSLFELGFAAAAVILAAAALFTLNQKEISDGLFFLASAAAAIGLSIVALASHPTSIEPPAAGIVSAVIHRTAFSLWLGGLPALLLLIGLGPVTEDSRFLSQTILRQFSRLATAAMLAIVASGAVLTWFLVRNFSSAIGTTYGQLLIIKLLLLSGVLLIANGLQRTLLPLLEMKPSDATIMSYARRVRIETAMAFLIVVVASEMAQRNPPEHEDIVWPFPFRFSIWSTWANPWVPTMVVSGVLLTALGAGLIALWWRPTLRPSRLSGLGPRATLGGGAAAVIAGCALALPAISVQAYPDTFLTTEIPYATQSIAAGLRHIEDNCTPCHGDSGLGNGPMAKSLPRPPADFSAPHTSLHTAGDLYWWVTHGITPSGMPAFKDILTNDQRWDIINWLGAFSVSYQARVISASVAPNQSWLAPPDFQVTDQQGQVSLLSDYRRKSALLLVFCAGPQDAPRIEQLLAARGHFDQLGLQIVLIAPDKTGGSLRALAANSILIARNDPDDVLAAYGMFTRTFADAKVDRARVPVEHAEFLIDFSGYIRARWIPSQQSDDPDSWSDLANLDKQLAILAREPPKPPPPDIHSLH